MYVRPISWIYNQPGSADANAQTQPTIQLFGYTTDNRSVNIKFPAGSTYIMRYSDPIDSEVIDELNDSLNADWIRESPLDPRVIMVHNPSLDTSDNSTSTWINSEKDPQGLLASFWQSSGIKPYDWLIINNYEILTTKTTICDLEVIMNETSLIHANLNLSVSNSRKLLFWDIEVLNPDVDQFPSADNPNHIIFMISLIISFGDRVYGYLLLLGNIATFDTPINISFIQYNNEKDLLTGFFDIIGREQPDRMISYNGDLFDMPYIAKRCRLHNIIIPPISKFVNYRPQFVDKRIATPFGIEFAKSLILPGIEQLDLLPFARRFYPSLPNHKLETFSQYLIGEGKTGLDIETMIQHVKSLDPERMRIVAEYSVKDSLLLYRDWQEAKIEQRLELIANSSGILIDEVINSSFDKLVESLAYNIDPSSTFKIGFSIEPTHLLIAQPGIYSNVFIYDYANLYLQLLIESNIPLNREIGLRLRNMNAPSNLIYNTFFSRYVDRNFIMPLFNSILSSFTSVIEIGPFELKVTSPLTESWLIPVNTLLHYVVISKASFILHNDDDSLTFQGPSQVCRPPFDLARQLIIQQLRAKFNGDVNPIAIPTTPPIDSLIITTKLKDKSHYDRNSAKYKLATQYDKSIQTWVNIKYIQTVKGPRLFDKWRPKVDKINTTFYRRKINDLLKTINSLPFL